MKGVPTFEKLGLVTPATPS